jgi:hypothetical protein
VTLSHRSRAYLCASLTVLLWSTVTTAFKIALYDPNNVQVLLVANITSLIVFIVLLAAAGKFSEVRATGLYGIGFSALQGLLTPFAYYLVVFKAYSLLPDGILPGQIKGRTREAPNPSPTNPPHPRIKYGAGSTLPPGARDVVCPEARLRGIFRRHTADV